MLSLFFTYETALVLRNIREQFRSARSNSLIMKRLGASFLEPLTALGAPSVTGQFPLLLQVTAT
jgi:hypothetical protein